MTGIRTCGPPGRITLGIRSQKAAGLRGGLEAEESEPVVKPSPLGGAHSLAFLRRLAAYGGGPWIKAGSKLAPVGEGDPPLGAVPDNHVVVEPEI